MVRADRRHTENSFISLLHHWIFSERHIHYMSKQVCKTGAWSCHACRGNCRTRCRCIDGGFNPELVKRAGFDGILEIPRIPPPEEMIIPRALIPFSQRNRSRDCSEFLVFYENDENFADLMNAVTKRISCRKNSSFLAFRRTALSPSALTAASGAAKTGNISGPDSPPCWKP